MRNLTITKAPTLNKDVVSYELQVIHNGIKKSLTDYGRSTGLNLRKFSGKLYVDEKPATGFTIRVDGDAERQALIEIFSSIIEELENNPKVL
jgi:hypothetical protein